MSLKGSRLNTPVKIHKIKYLNGLLEWQKVQSRSSSASPWTNALDTASANSDRISKVLQRYMVFALSSGEEGVQPEGLFVPCLPSSGWASPPPCLQQSIWCTTLLHSGWGYSPMFNSHKGPVVLDTLAAWFFSKPQAGYASYAFELNIIGWFTEKDTHSQKSFRKIWITMYIGGCQNLSHRTVLHQLLWPATLVSFLKWVQIFTGGR